MIGFRISTWLRDATLTALALALFHSAAMARAEDAGAPAPSGKLEAAIGEQLASDRETAASQVDVTKLDDATRALLLEYRQLDAETKSLNEYADSLEVQIRSQSEEIGLVERQLVEIESTARDVTPMVKRMVDALDRFVGLDLPFLLEERQKRVLALKDMLGRANVTISEKYRRVVEAYQIEMDYGRTLEAYQGPIGDGDDARTVQFLRVGRVALLYQTLDGRETGYWDADAKGWVVDNSYRNAVREGFAVATKQGAPELLLVPVHAAEESQS
jgi:hypothetical protein